MLQVYALTGGLPHAIMPAVEVVKGKKKAGKAVRWGWVPFTPAARKDALQLHHWVSRTFSSSRFDVREGIWAGPARCSDGLGSASGWFVL